MKEQIRNSINGSSKVKEIRLDKKTHALLAVFGPKSDS